MATLAEIKQKVIERQNTPKPEPIEYEQAIMWQKLKNSHEIREPVFNMGEIIRCPVCGSEHMHHIGIELFNRKEDDETGEHIQLYVHQSHAWHQENIKPPDHSIDDNMKNNPSERRSGMYIKFICEECSSFIDLAISQHKGQSLLHWRYNT